MPFHCVLVKDIERKRGNVRAVALYNPSDTICSFTVPMNILELGGKVKARDLVKQQDLPEIKGGVLNRELPPHSVLILRMESEKRLEPTVYEAEWAYLPCFNDLGKTPKSIVYVPLHEASGGMKVSYLGGRKENFADKNANIRKAIDGFVRMFGKDVELEKLCKGIGLGEFYDSLKDVRMPTTEYSPTLF